MVVVTISILERPRRLRAPLCQDRKSVSSPLAGYVTFLCVRMNAAQSCLQTGLLRGTVKVKDV